MKVCLLKRKEFPSWLAVLSEEQAEVLNVQGSETGHILLGEASIFFSYDNEAETGFIFVLEELQAHQIQIRGDIKYYRQLIENIKER